MRCAAIDEWRQWNARRNTPLRLAVSLDNVRNEATHETYADLLECPRCVDPGMRVDVKYLFWYFERHGLMREREIARLVYEGYTKRQIARRLGIEWKHFRRDVLPRWQGICQQILDS